MLLSAAKLQELRQRETILELDAARCVPSADQYLRTTLGAVPAVGGASWAIKSTYAQINIFNIKMPARRFQVDGIYAYLELFRIAPMKEVSSVSQLQKPGGLTESITVTISTENSAASDNMLRDLASAIGLSMLVGNKEFLLASEISDAAKEKTRTEIREKLRKPGMKPEVLEKVVAGKLEAALRDQAAEYLPLNSPQLIDSLSLSAATDPTIGDALAQVSRILEAKVSASCQRAN